MKISKSFDPEWVLSLPTIYTSVRNTTKQGKLRLWAYDLIKKHGGQVKIWMLYDAAQSQPEFTDKMIWHVLKASIYFQAGKQCGLNCFTITDRTGQEVTKSFPQYHPPIRFRSYRAA